MQKMEKGGGVRERKRDIACERDSAREKGQRETARQRERERERERDS